MGSSASLDRSSKKNWVERSGGLPPYVREIARSIEKAGKTLSAAISIALSRIKVWATGKGVTAKTQAKAAKALAQWEATRAKNKARGAASVAASSPMTGGDGLSLASVDDVLSPADIELIEVLSEQVTLSARDRGYCLALAATTPGPVPTAGEAALDRVLALARGDGPKNRPTGPAASGGGTGGDGSGKHDLIWFSRRSTPMVVARGAEAKDPPESYGKQVRRAAADEQDEKDIARNGWVQKDQHGNRPGDAGYTKTKLRPQLVK